MKLQELRIGNLVTYNPNCVDKGTKIIPLEVECIYGGEFSNSVRLNDGYDNEYGVDEILPILITEEWLLKLGFEPVNILHDGTKVFRAEPYFYFKDGIGRISIHAPEIKYVHQLQNLYFALTGEELTINPDKPKE